MNVLFVTHYIYMMGANRSMLQLMLELREHGVNPIVLLPSHRLRKKHSEKTLVDYLEENGISYIPAPFRMAKMSSTALTSAVYIYNHLRYPGILRKVTKHEIDLVHTNSSVTDIGAFLSRRLGVPHVWHLREYGDLDYNLAVPFGRWFERRYFGGHNHFIAISESIRNHYTDKIPENDISVIYNGIKVPETTDSKRPDNIINICIVGYITPQKRQLDVVKAIHQLSETYGPEQLHLYLVGREVKSYADEIRQYISRHSLDKYVTFTGQIDDICGFMQGMHIGVLSSASEAFGRVTVEYMMNSLAVIASDGGASREIITEGVDGLLYPVGDIEALSSALASLIDTPTLMNSLATRGHSMALARFSSDANTAAILAVYRNPRHYSTDNQEITPPPIKRTHENTTFSRDKCNRGSRFNSPLSG